MKYKEGKRLSDHEYSGCQCVITHQILRFFRAALALQLSRKYLS